MNIAGMLEAQARHHGARPAIVEPGRTITFADLDAAAGSAASDLVAAGVGSGQRVLVFSPMSIALYTTLIGLFRLRATAVFIDPSAGRERLDQCIRRVQPAALVAVPRAHLLRFTSAAMRAIPIKAAIGGRVPLAASVARRVSTRRRPVEPCDPDTPAIVTFTSGSTGEPKAVVRTHGFLLAQHRALAASLHLEAGDIDLCTLPIFLLANLASGVTSVIPDADLRAPGAIDAGPVLDQIAATRPARTVASPAFLARLTEAAAHRGTRLTTFRRIYTGGAPVFPRLLDDIAGVAPAAAVVAVYGSTEAEPIAEINRADLTAADRDAMLRGAGLLAGPPTSSTELRILPDRWSVPVGPMSAADLARDTLPAHQAGEIVVAGDHVLGGYLDGRGDEETKIRVGDRVWHRTGDAGYVDDAGRVWLLGRCAAKVADADGVLYPFAVEAAASELPNVARTAFVRHGSRRVLVAEITGDAGQTRAELLARLDWARLADVVIVQRIPVDRRHNAKVEYPALLRMLEERLPPTARRR